MTTMPQDFADYLRTMISPEERTLTTTEGGECVYLHVTDPDTFPWADHADGSVHGLTVEATSVAGQATWIPEAYRVLKPGAHLMLVAPDDEPVGDTGACIAEDLGFEVRDAILWVHGEGAADRLHYTAKAARAEREAGLAHLPLRVVVGGDGEGGDDDDDADGAERPPVQSTVRNFHPTVKPVAVMSRLMADVPSDRGPILDPFMGSGTTMLACIDTGHDGIGIERDPEYFPIADARVRHRDAASAAWDAATITSDVPPAAPDDAEVDLNDFLGL